MHTSRMRSIDPIALVVLRELQARDWCQVRLAHEARVNRCDLSRWLAGRRQIRSNALARVLAVLDIRVMRKEDIDAEARRLSLCFVPARPARPTR